MERIEGGGEDAQLDNVDRLPVPYCEVNAEGMIVRANRAARAMRPPQLSEIVGTYVWDLVPEDEREMSRSAYLGMMESGQEPPLIQRTIFSQGRGYRTYQIHRILIRDAQGRATGLHSLTVDVTDRQIAIEQAQQKQRWLESILGSMDEAVIAADSLGFVRYVNHAAEELTGWSAEDLHGKVIEQVLPEIGGHYADQPQLSHSHTLEKHWKGVATVLHREGRELRLEISTAPIVDREIGCTIGVVTVLRAIAEMRELAATSKPVQS